MCTSTEQVLERRHRVRTEALRRVLAHREGLDPVQAVPLAGRRSRGRAEVRTGCICNIVLSLVRQELTDLLVLCLCYLLCFVAERNVASRAMAASRRCTTTCTRCTSACATRRCRPRRACSRNRSLIFTASKSSQQSSSYGGVRMKRHNYFISKQLRKASELPSARRNENAPCWSVCLN